MDHERLYEKAGGAKEHGWVVSARQACSNTSERCFLPKYVPAEPQRASGVDETEQWRMSPEAFSYSLYYYSPTCNQKMVE